MATNSSKNNNHTGSVSSPSIVYKTPSAESVRKHQTGNASANTSYNEEYSNEGRQHTQAPTDPASQPINYKPPKLIRTHAKNPLNNYKSYSYIFTLAALKPSALMDPEAYRESSDYYVIAKSGGKGSVGIKTPSELQEEKDQDTSSYDSKDFRVSKAKTDTLHDTIGKIEGFNKNSSGRFDFYLDNVNIDTVMGFSKDTGLSVATKLEFDLIEPYSMNGFLEALQIAAIAAGYVQYSTCPFLLKMEFVGYPDSIENNSLLSDYAKKIDQSDRYFVFGFTGLEIDVTENGTRYKCSGVPFNEKGFGEPTTLKSPIKVKGNTIGDAVKSLMEGLNKSAETDARGERDVTSETQHDTYEVVFPKIENGIRSNDDENEIAQCEIIEFLHSDALYQFVDPGDVDNKRTSKQHYSPTDPVIQFSEKLKVTDCIAAIIRDSSYTNKIIKEFPNNVDQFGMLPYFAVHIEVEQKNYNNTKNRPFYLYRFVVIPYKMHYTRVPLTLKGTVDTSQKYVVSNRDYEYLYTGNNVDVRKFNLKFNSLFFQAIPKALGNKEGFIARSTSLASPNMSSTSLKPTDPNIISNSTQGVAIVAQDSTQLSVQTSRDPNGGQTQYDPYYSLSRNMHTAVLENVDQCTADIEIIGDPYYLVTGSMGNYRPVQTTYGMTKDGEATYTTGDIMVTIAFKNPIDIDPTTGEAIFDQEISSYSGLFRVLSVSSSFKGGEFLQTLHLNRVPSQPEDMNTTTGSKPPAIVNNTATTDDGVKEVNSEPVTERSTDANLSDTIINGSPVIVEPTSSDITTDTFSDNLSSTIRLTQSGLTELSTNILSAGASILQLGALSASMGFNNPMSLASTTLGMGLSSPDDIGSNPLATVSALGTDGALLSSEVGSKIDSIYGGVSTQLGQDTNSLSGLTTLSSKLPSQIQGVTAQLPANVDLNRSVSDGLLLSNIPTYNLNNIPASQPVSSAPLPLSAQASSFTPANGLQTDNAVIASKLSTMQNGLNSITSQGHSVESNINRLTSYTNSNLPNVSDVAPSIVNKFGSVSENTLSPLDKIMKA